MERKCLVLNSASRLIYNNITSGNTIIKNVTGQQAAINIAILYNQSGYKYLNYTIYNQYLQSKNNLYDVLSYYNTTTVSSDVESAINQTVASYITQEAKLTSASNSTSFHSCSFADAKYLCKTPYPFYYIINVTVAPSLAVQNQTLSFQGSLIRLIK